MRRMAFVLWVGLLWWWLLPTSTAYAGVTEWPVVRQLVNVGKCVVSDAGTITASAVTHLFGFLRDTAKTVSDCLVYSAGQVTGVGDPNPLHEEHD